MTEPSPALPRYGPFHRLESPTQTSEDARRQLESGESGEGRRGPVIEQSPAELERRYGLTFERGVDSLDEYLLAAVEDPELGQLVLFRHVQAPFHGTEVMVDVAERTSRALCAIESTLGIQQRQLSWIAEDEVDPRLEFILSHRASRLASRS